MASVSKTKMRLLEFISSQNGLDFSGCRARMSKKKNLLVEDHGNLVFYIDKVHMAAILERDYKTEDIIVLSESKNTAYYRYYQEYIQKKQEEEDLRRAEKEAAKEARRIKQQRKQIEKEAEERGDFPKNLEAVVSDLEADKTIKFVDCSYEIRSRVFCGTGLRIMITIRLDVYEKNRKLASFCGSNMDNIFISDKVDILEKIRNIMSSEKNGICLTSEGRQILKRKTYLFLKKLKSMSVSREFLKIVDKPSFLEYMDFLKHNHAKECQDKLQISFVQLAREDILRYKIFEQDFFYNIKENAVFLPDEELLELKELVGFEKTNRSSLKQFLKAAEKIKDTNCQVVKVEGDFGIRVRTLMGKKYIKQTFFQFSAAGLQKWYKEREAELKHKKIEYAKSLQSYGNLLAGDIYDLVCQNSFITKEECLN